MSEFRNNVLNFYGKHEKAFEKTKKISLIVSAGLMALLLGIMVASNIIVNMGGV